MSKPKDLYHFWNSRYFRSKLPDIPVRWSPNYYKGRNRKCLGSTWFDHKTKLPKLITLNPAMKPYSVIWQSTLLHEMVHVEQWKVPTKQAHGNKFNKRMKQLANLGAFRGLW